MTHHGVLGNYQFQEASGDIRGAHLYGLEDEKLGKIQDVIFDHSNGTIRYVVVDTGGWLATKEFIVPADRLRTSAKHDGDFEADLTKKQIESFPPYDKNNLQSQESWADYEGRYRAKWESHPVMHRAETDRNVTPTTQQLQGNPVSISAERGTTASQTRRYEAASVSAADAPTERIVPAGTDSVAIDNSAVVSGSLARAS
jgi:PRC-barrel domain